MKKSRIDVERIQTGVRLEKKILKVLKGIAEYRDLSLGELLEIMALHAFEGRPAFNKEGQSVINDLKKIYSLDYGVHDYETFIENRRGGR